MAKKRLWQWSDGVTVHRGYATKKEAKQAWHEHFDANRAVLDACHSWAYSVSSYCESYTVHGPVQRFSLPSRGEHSLHAPNGVYATLAHKAGLKGQDKPHLRQLRSPHKCDSCGAVIDTAFRYKDDGMDYYGCPDPSCCEEVPPTAAYWRSR